MINDNETSKPITYNEILIELQHHISKLRDSTYDLDLVNTRIRTIEALTNLLGVLTARDM